ncbi:unnamed protein product [Nesidiocoris tenuis]|uniref:Ig-like domain-containing protein n=1 Tax=Nesidiocoris tenuis TaxID=355587 RepID=A0A6H5GMW3_9HEMI|nr:unnamed protein product [Nesidiocoris tenuis]
MRFLRCCESGPRFLVDPPRELIVWYKDGALANCVASGSPEPKVTWFLSGETTPLQPVPNVRRVLDNGSLYFPPFKPEEFRPDVHLTTYRCFASNSAGKLLSLDMTVKAVMVENYQVEATVAGGPLFVGDTAVLRCKVPQHLEGIITVTAWLIDESYNVYPTTEGEGKYVMPSWNGDLHILNLSLSDTRKKYSCRTLHRLSGKSQHSNSVNIQLAEASKPQLVYEFLEHTLQPGPPVSLKCIASGSPTPQITWSLDGYPLPINERFIIGQYVSLNGEVISHVNLTKVAVEDGGVYTCKASNKAGSVEHSAPLRVYGM